MSHLPYDALGGISLPEVHDWMVKRIMAMSELFDQVFREGIRFWGKKGYDGVEGSDVVGAADEALQKDFLAAFLQKLKGWGIIAEEDGLRIKATLVTPWGPVVVTLDPVDGTGQLRRIVEEPGFPRQGVSIMISIRLGNTVIAAYIFDLFTKELFFVNPGESSPVMRQVGEVVEPVLPAGPGELNRGTLLVHGSMDNHRELDEWLASLDEPPFAERIRVKESIGLTLLQIVQGRAVALARRPDGFFTPWDDSPLIRFGRAAGIHSFWIKPAGVFEEFILEPPTQGIKREFGVLYLPARFVGQLRQLADVRTL